MFPPNLSFVLTLFLSCQVTHHSPAPLRAGKAEAGNRLGTRGCEQTRSPLCGRRSGRGKGTRRGEWLNRLARGLKEWG